MAVRTTIAIQLVSEIYDAFGAFNSIETNSSTRPVCDDLIVSNFQTLLIIYTNLCLASPPTLAQSCGRQNGA